MTNKILHIFLCLAIPIAWGVVVQWIFSRFYPTVFQLKLHQNSNSNSLHLNDPDHKKEEGQGKEA